MLSFAAPAYCDEIRLFSGETVTGRILARDNQAVYLQASGFIRNFHLDQISSINQEILAGGGAGEVLSPQRPQNRPHQVRVQALPYPLIAFAYRALHQKQLTFDPYHSRLTPELAGEMRDLFILTDRSTAAFVQTLLWRQSKGREGRSDKLLTIEIKKLLEKIEMLSFSTELKPVQAQIYQAINGLHHAFFTEKNIEFEDFLRRARAALRNAEDYLTTRFSYENTRNQNAWSYHLKALLSIEFGLRS